MAQLNQPNGRRQNFDWNFCANVAQFSEGVIASHFTGPIPYAVRPELKSRTYWETRATDTKPNRTQQFNIVSGCRVSLHRDKDEMGSSVLYTNPMGYLDGE